MGTESTLKKLMLLGLMAALVGCGSGDTEEDDLDELYPDEIPAEEASTDAVPAEPAEDPAPVEVAVDEPNANELEAAPSASGGIGQTVSYTLRSGDTLMKLAFETYGDVNRWRDIYNANQNVLSDYNSIPAGVTLQIEAPDSAPQISRNGQPYSIQNGDTLGTISNYLYGTPSKWRKIWKNNRKLIKDPNKIYAGFTLYYEMTPEDESDRQRLGGGSSASGQSVADSAQAVEAERQPAAAETVPAIE